MKKIVIVRSQFIMNSDGRGYIHSSTLDEYILQSVRDFRPVAYIWNRMNTIDIISFEDKLRFEMKILKSD